MARKKKPGTTKIFQFKVNTVEDKDIIDFINIQPNNTALLKTVIRELIEKYGYVDVSKYLKLI